MFKIVFFDLDGTLLTHEKQVLEDSKKAIKYARENGVEVCICSGRQKGAVKFYQEMAGAGRYVITTNGAEIYDTQDREELFYSKVDIDMCKKVFEFSMKNDLYVRIDTEYGRYTNKIELAVLDEVELEQNMDKFFEENHILQITIGSTDSSNIDKVIELLDDKVKIENRYNAKIPLKGGEIYNLINIINVSASKGNAILGLCKYLKINPNEAMAFGDDLNDISMMKSVYGVAMKNAVEEVKKYAKEELSTTNEGNGIAEILYRIVEENKKC